MNPFTTNRGHAAAILLGLGSLLAGCGGSSNNNSAPAPQPPAASTCPTIGNLVPVEIGTDVCQLSGVLTQNANLSAADTWLLEGALQIGDADNQVTLSIDPGTQIMGDAAGEVDYVLVFPGSNMEANGTAAQPVQFLSEDDGVDGSGEWGGVFLRGFNGLPTLTGVQGANRLDYVVVAEAGASVDVTIDGNTVSYADNIVLNGVDNTTTLTFVQSHNSARDGLHILNGDPRLAWILATGAQRDGVWYRNFSGLIKDLMVIHQRDPDSSTGRSGIYASETVDGDSNPRIVNATLVGRDSESVAAADGDAEFGILFADNSDQIRLANVLIANFRHGCFSAREGADLSAIDTDVPGPTYLDGIHCANEAGPNPAFGQVTADAVGFSDGVVAANNSLSADGLVYYNGAANPITFTGEIADRSENFTASWYLDNIGGIGNGLVADTTYLNAFLDGDTNNDRSLDAADTNSPFIIADDGAGGFNQDVAADTGGYDMTHIGAVRGGAPSNAQFDGWTVATGADDGFVVAVNDALIGMSDCPVTVGGADVVAMERQGGRNVCEVSGVVTTAGTLTSNIEWMLGTSLQIGSATSIAELEIQAGTRIRGGDTDYVLVYPGSQLMALGTGARPVRFSSDDVGIDGSAEWGGLFIRGYGSENVVDLNGSNLLDYVVVAEAGAEVTLTVGGNEITYADNIVINGVDRNTRLTFVQSHNSARDGLHIVDSDARMSWILATGAQRDGIWYQDFNGVLKDLMVIHNRDAAGTSGRAGIYASRSEFGDSNPRIVNATLVGRDAASVPAAEVSDREFGILFADNTDAIRLGNILIANFRNGCYEAEGFADLGAIEAGPFGPSYLDGVHCAHEAGANPMFGVVREDALGFGLDVVAPNNSNDDGLVYYNGAGGELPIANTPFTAAAGGINFTGELVDRSPNFTAGWYLDNIRGVGNGLVADPLFLNGFLDGDTNFDGVVDAADTNSPFILLDDGPDGFNQDVASDTGGYDMTHVGAVRGGAVTNQQFDHWTVGTLRSEGFTVRTVQ